MICRLCLEELNDDFVPIFEENGKATAIAKIITKYFHIKLSDEDNVVSNKICTSCWYQLHDFHQFWLRIEQKQETLQWEHSAAAFVTVVDDPTEQRMKDDTEDVKEMVLGEPEINIVSLNSILKEGKNTLEELIEVKNPIEEHDCTIQADNAEFNSTDPPQPYIYDENLKELLDLWRMPEFVLDQCIKFGIRTEHLKNLDNDDINALIPNEYLDIRVSFKAVLSKFKGTTQEIGHSNSSDYDSASSCERSYYILNINEMLSQSSLGRQLKRNSDENQKLTTQQQNILVDLVIGEYLKRGINLSTKEIDKLADNLIQNFPSEKKDTYFIKRCGKTNPKGKLYDKYKNLKKKFRKANLKEKFKKQQELCIPKTILVPFATPNKDYFENTFDLNTLSSSSAPNYTQLCKRSYYRMNIGKVLSQSSLGQQLKRNFAENKKLMPKQQNVLVDLLIGEYFKQGINLSIKEIEKLADNVIKHFPSEKKDTYFVRRCGKANPKGKLYDKYKNLKKKLKKIGLIESNSVHEDSVEFVIPHEGLTIKPKYHKKKHKFRQKAFKKKPRFITMY